MQGVGAGIGPVFILKTHNQTNYKCLPNSCGRILRLSVMVISYSQLKFYKLIFLSGHVFKSSVKSNNEFGRAV